MKWIQTHPQSSHSIAMNVAEIVKPNDDTKKESTGSVTEIVKPNDDSKKESTGAGLEDWWKNNEII